MSHLFTSGHFPKAGAPNIYLQADYFCGSGLGSDKSAAAQKNDGKDLAMPIICKASLLTLMSEMNLGKN